MPVELSIWLLSSLLLLLIVCVGLLGWQLMKLLTKSQQSQSQMAQTELLREQEQTLRFRQMTQLVDKAIALVGTADPLAYQQVQAMETTLTGYDGTEFDPSDEAELARINQRHPDLNEGDDVNGFESTFLADIADAGLDGEFFDIPDPDRASGSR